MPEVIDRVMKKIRAQRGLPVRIAEACGIKRMAVYQWKRVPPERVHVVAELTGLMPSEIRPDIFRQPSQAWLERRQRPHALRMR